MPLMRTSLSGAVSRLPLYVVVISRRSRHRRSRSTAIFASKHRPQYGDDGIADASHPSQLPILPLPVHGEVGPVEALDEQPLEVDGLDPPL